MDLASIFSGARRLLPGLALFFAASAGAQVPDKGDPASLDVAGWNVERFGDTGGPSNDERQFDHVLETIRDAGIDLWALQEMNSGPFFDRLVDELGEPWAGQRVVGTASIGYGFVYNTDVIRRIRSSTILTSDAFQFAGRPPLELVADVVLPDTTVRMNFISLHMKAGVGADDYDRRLASADALLGYLAPRAGTNRYVVLGDFNDELISSIRSGRSTPFRQLLQSDDVEFLTVDFDQPGGSNDLNTFCSSSTCSSGSVLDHALVSVNLSDDVVRGSVARFDELLSVFSGYTSNTSDHLPVLTRIRFNRAVANESVADPLDFALAAPYPNPFRGSARLQFTLPAPADVRLDVFDALGRRVQTLASGRMTAGDHPVTLDGEGLAPGLYVVRLTAAGQSATRRLVRVR